MSEIEVRHEPHYTVGVDPARGDDYGCAVLIERDGDHMTVVDATTLQHEDADLRVAWFEGDMRVDVREEYRRMSELARKRFEAMSLSDQAAVRKQVSAAFGVPLEMLPEPLERPWRDEVDEGMTAQLVAHVDAYLGVAR